MGLLTTACERTGLSPDTLGSLFSPEEVGDIEAGDMIRDLSTPGREEAGLGERVRIDRPGPVSEFVKNSPALGPSGSGQVGAIPTPRAFF
ncbi:MAG: hypothetical protein ACREXW_09640 [Gammaproteobacteria bacterium]